MAAQKTKEAKEIKKKTGNETSLKDISLQKKLSDPESQWNESLALLCRNQGVKALFWIMSAYDGFNQSVRQGLRELIAEENWLRQCATRLGTASFSPQLLGWLWQLAPDGEILPLLVDMLGEKNEELRTAAAETLLTVNDRRAIPYLAGALMQPQRFAAARVAEVLHGLGPVSATVLSKILPEVGSTSQETLLKALEDIKKLENDAAPQAQDNVGEAVATSASAPEPEGGSADADMV